MEEIPEGTRITAIDKRDRFVFTPLLYEYLAGELERDVVAPHYDTLIPSAEVELIQARVERIDVAERRVVLEGGEAIDYDALVLAPGSVPAFHGVPGAEAHGIPFYSFDDAERLRTTLLVREWARGDQPACVVGGGVVGIELAFALA
ncbi:MAG TPA: FAD-dependent oxidoreductase, partial [Nannocystis sp.]